MVDRRRPVGRGLDSTDCPRCAHVNPGWCSFCTKCGKRFAADPANAATLDIAEPASRKRIAIAVLLLLGSFTLGLVLSQDDAPPELVLEHPTPSTETKPQAILPARFKRTPCGAIQEDGRSLEWFVGPDETLTYAEAQRWVDILNACGGGWLMPTTEELLPLFEADKEAGVGFLAKGRRFVANLDPVFAGIGEGSWVWADTERTQVKATAINFHIPKEVELFRNQRRYTVRVFAVRYKDTGDHGDEQVVIRVLTRAGSRSALGKAPVVEIREPDVQASGLRVRDGRRLRLQLEGALVGTWKIPIVADPHIKDGVQDAKNATYRSRFDESLRVSLGKAAPANHSLHAKLERNSRRCLLSIGIIHLESEILRVTAVVEADAPCTTRVADLLTSAALRELQAQPANVPELPPRESMDAKDTLTRLDRQLRNNLDQRGLNWTDLETLSPRNAKTWASWMRSGSNGTTQDIEALHQELEITSALASLDPELLSPKLGKAVIKGDTADIKTKNGKIKMRTEAPTDFPLPLFEDSEVVRSVKMNNKAQGRIHIVALKTKKSAETASEFYKKALKDKGLEVVANESKAGEMTMVNLSGKKDKIIVGVNVMNNSDGTVINISWNEKP